MPRIEAINVGAIWVAWTENDFGFKDHARFGFTENHAKSRVAKALWDRDEA